MNCPVCQRELMIVEDWPLGRVSRCPEMHFQRSEDFDKRSIQMERISEKDPNAS